MAEGKSLRLGFLVIIADLYSNEHKAEWISLIDRSMKFIDKKKFQSIETHWNNLIDSNEFSADSQYRQIQTVDNGSMIGFLHFPSFHTVLNVFKEFLIQCHCLSIIFIGQQIDINGAWIFNDCTLTSEHFHRLIEETSPIATEDLQMSFPYVSPSWTRFSSNYLSKRFKHVRLDDLSSDPPNENPFGEIFLQRFKENLVKETIQFDLEQKLIPRENAGAIAFDEANLYVFYSQQGEASLFAIRGFVLLINGGFSRIPSFWNFIRGLQTIDACILTHFDFDVLPGLQSVLHRKTISMSEQGQTCKPNIAAIFLNQIQRAKILSSTKKSTHPQKTLVNLNQNIEQFNNDLKRLNLDQFDLVKQISASKPTVEPINLFRKIAFGSLDLYVLHPTSLAAEDDKLLSTIQKIPIRDHQPSPSIIPLHHWYSACFLLVWNPTSKSTKDPRVRILFTGACPQTLVFEALNRARHLDVLHESTTNGTASKLRTQSATTKPNKTPVRSSKSATPVHLKDSPPSRPTSVPLTSPSTEAFVQSSQTTPNEDLTSQLLPMDPMTTSFVDGAPNSRNPFLDPSDSVDLVEHTIPKSSSTLSSIDEINPQGLPMDSKRNHVRSNTTTTNASGTSRKGKTTIPSGSIYHVDVAYIPYHGDEHYVDSEFFRRIRARYYILNAVDIHRVTLESLLDGKEQWDKEDQGKAVTLVPTFDGDPLRQFFVMNRTRLQELNVTILPASTRCHVQYDDQSSPAQRLRFSSSS